MQTVPDRTFQFAVRIVKLCQHLEESGGVARTIGKQLLRSGTSIGANVQEGQAGQSKADFISKNYIALKEARETLYWLKLLAATDILPESRLTPIAQEAEERRRHEEHWREQCAQLEQEAKRLTTELENAE